MTSPMTVIAVAPRATGAITCFGSPSSARGFLGNEVGERRGCLLQPLRVSTSYSRCGLTALTLLFVIAAWAILTGVMEVIAAVRLRQVVSNEWALIFSGVLSVIFGVLLVAQPGAGALAVVWLIGTYAVIFGVAMLAVAWRLRGMLEDMRDLSSGVRETRAA